MTIKQETFPFARADESQKNAIVILKDGTDDESFYALRWVLKARSEASEMMHLCSVHHDGEGVFVATDGHRLHLAEIEALTERIPAGIWLYVHGDKKKLSLKEAPEGICKYPNYSALLDLSENHKKRGLIDHLDGDESATVWRYWDLVGVKCNIEYLIDVLDGTGGMEVYADDPRPGIVTGRDPLPLIFYSGSGEGITRKALIMPLKG